MKRAPIRTIFVDGVPWRVEMIPGLGAKAPWGDEPARSPVPGTGGLLYRSTEGGHQFVPFEAISLHRSAEALAVVGEDELADWLRASLARAPRRA